MAVCNSDHHCNSGQNACSQPLDKPKLFNKWDDYCTFCDMFRELTWIVIHGIITLVTFQPMTDWRVKTMPLMLMVPDHKYSIIQMVSMIEILLFRSWSRFHKSWVHVLNNLRPMPTHKFTLQKASLKFSIGRERLA